jgi:heme exporter protein D
MAFSSVSDFFAMGGYGFYVWLAYGVSAFVMAGLVIEGRWARRSLKCQLKSEQARAARITAAKSRSAS